ncbi:hypothetical protein CLIB1444_03S09912 [[Candida] jaroonii]|uniref:Uncharacterized protein n=1 Tax=[Candida] jaroonii TaxID=467808 RepID=A0ACA9Y5Q3_9ASCO|nr:hypothetical protein CLIB1444_03S09912 [[Candida] jaroonii]
MGKDLHKRSISSFDDMEKSIALNDEDIIKEKKNKKVDIFLIIIVSLLVGTIVNFVLFSNFKSINLKVFNENAVEKLLDVENINLKEVQDNEWNKFHSNSPKGEVVLKSASIEDSTSSYINEDVEHNDPQKDLAEILSINSIVILTNEENIKLQTKVENILKNYKITPEIKFIKLNKHPNYDNIYQYLKKFTISDYGIEINNDDENDIPRLFIGGLPMGNYKDIIRKANAEELYGYLKKYGKGLITLEL